MNQFNQVLNSKLSIIQSYAPTEDEEKDEFKYQLQGGLFLTKREILLAAGNLNAKEGADKTGFEQYIGKQGLGTRNNNGARFLELCVENDMAIGDTMFQHKDIHQKPGTHQMELLSTNRSIDSLSVSSHICVCVYVCQYV